MRLNNNARLYWVEEEILCEDGAGGPAIVLFPAEWQECYASLRWD